MFLKLIHLNILTEPGHKLSMENSEEVGSFHKGKKIRSYTVSFKLKVMEFAKANQNNTSNLTAKTFGVSRTRVIEWTKAEKDFLELDGKRKKNWFWEKG